MRVELEHKAGTLSVIAAIECPGGDCEAMRADVQSMIAAGFGGECGVGAAGAKVLADVLGSDIRLDEDLDAYLDGKDVQEPWRNYCEEVVRDRRMLHESTAAIQGHVKFASAVRGWISAAISRNDRMAAAEPPLYELPDWFGSMIGDIQGLSWDASILVAAREHIGAVIHEGEGRTVCEKERVPPWAQEATAEIAELRTEIARLKQGE